MVGRFFGKDIIKRAECPFCGLGVDRPGESSTEISHEMPIGRCGCGAVYVCDVTGHNLGTALVDALVFACEGNWEGVWELQPDRDYLEGRVENYDEVTHRVIPGGAYEGRRIGGVLYFILLKTGQVSPRLGTIGALQGKKTGTTSPADERSKRTFSKKDVEKLVRAYDVEAVLTLAEKDKRIVRDLQRLLYSAEVLLRHQAADLLGQVCAVIAQQDPGSVTRFLQGLFTSILDTAASSWGSVDAIGEIIRNSPERFSAHIGQLYQLTRDRALVGDILRALARISETRPAVMRKTAYQFIRFLADADPGNRACAAIILGNLDAREAGEDISRLADDSSAIELYRNGKMESLTVGQVASEVLRTL
jgi:hypothetical protein